MLTYRKISGQKLDGSVPTSKMQPPNPTDIGKEVTDTEPETDIDLDVVTYITPSTSGATQDLEPDNVPQSNPALRTEDVSGISPGGGATGSSNGDEE